MPIAITATWVAAPQDEELVAETLRQLTAPSQAEPGNLVYVPTRSLEQPHTFVVLEVYADDDALAAHRQTPHFQAAVASGVLDRLVSRTVHRLEVL